jgi:beta,beta-carotene 9',10'-dioxygenase
MKNFVEMGFGKTERELEIDNLPVQGKMPEWLEGSFIRNGPGTFEVGEQKYRHWFDGLAMLHKFSFKEGKVSYRNKFLECKAYNEAMETGKIAYSEYATDPCRSLFHRVTAVFDQKITDSAKVNISKITDHYLALSETSHQIEVDPHSLKSLGEYNYETKYKQHITTVHPTYDFSTGEVFQLITRFSRLSHYRMIRIKPDGKKEVVGEIPVTYPAYLHSFGMSRNYLILAEFPLVVYPLKLLFQLKPFIENFKWKPRQGTTFWIMDRYNGKIAGKYITDSFFAFHHVNAFEKGNELILDIDAYPDASIIDSFYINRLRDENLELPFGLLKRYRIDLSGSGKIKEEILSDECIEMPRFDYEKLNMNADYQYVYGLGVNKNHRKGFFNQLIKIDIKSQKSKTWFADHQYPSEPVFIAKPGSTREDDGVVVTIVLDAEKGFSYLLVLDAGSFEEIGRAVVEQPILIGYHGTYFPEVK